MSEPLGTPIKTAGRTMIYLDWSIVVDLAEGNLRPLWNGLRDAKASGLVVPFSMAHLVDSGVTERSVTPEQANLISERLAFLSDLTRDHFLFVGGNPSAVQLFQNSPQRLQRGARILAPSFQEMKADLSQYTTEDLRTAREALDLDPNRINNLKPPYIIQQLDDILADVTAKKRPHLRPPSVSRCLEEVASGFPGGLGIADRVALSIASLTFLGYFPDRAGIGARTWTSATDGAHAAFAVATQAFVTADKALRLKALAAYEFLGIDTPILAGCEALDFVAGLATTRSTGIASFGGEPLS